MFFFKCVIRCKTKSCNS